MNKNHYKIHILFFIFPLFYLPDLLMGVNRINNNVPLLLIFLVLRDSFILMYLIRNIKIENIFTYKNGFLILLFIQLFFILFRDLILNINSITLSYFIHTFYDFFIAFLIIYVFTNISINKNSINKIFSSLSYASLFVFIFFIYEVLHPSKSVYLFVLRYRSCLFSPTVLGNYSMLIILYMLIDLIKSKKKKVLSFLTLIINLILLLFSGARTPLLAILIILLFLPLIINIDTKNILRLCSIVVIFCIIVLIIINNKNVQIRNSDITMFGTRGLTTRIQHLSRINSDLSLETIILGKGLYVTEPPIDLFWYNIFLYFGVFGIFNYGSIIMLSIIRLKKISHNNISNEIIFDKMIITIISFSISLFTTNIIASFPLNFIYFSMLGLSYNDLSLKSNTYYEK